ncbi:hypothetical protein M218_09290 [Burkholderia pseudomallei MSHR338]|nr:hypothetical protein M218_09290 [Burkholderia pseudomallei MSHR338]
MRRVGCAGARDADRARSANLLVRCGAMPPD